MRGACKRIGGLPCSEYLQSPEPSNFSQPIESIMILLSSGEDVLKPILLGRLLLSRPLITSLRGLCVARIKCIPTALALPAILTTDSSTSCLLKNIKSASSSTITKMYGNLSDGDNLELSSSKSFAPTSCESL